MPGGIHMSPIPALDYSLLYGERIVRSVAHNTREDGHEFLLEAAGIPVRTHTGTFSFNHANEALVALKNDSIRGAGVLVVDRGLSMLKQGRFEGTRCES